MLVLTALNITNANDIAAELFGDIDEDDADANASNGQTGTLNQKLQYLLDEIKKLKGDTAAPVVLAPPTDGDKDDDNAK
jgi:hypothetical protein